MLFGVAWLLRDDCLVADAHLAEQLGRQVIAPPCAGGPVEVVLQIEAVARVAAVDARAGSGKVAVRTVFGGGVHPTIDGIVNGIMHTPLLELFEKTGHWTLHELFMNRNASIYVGHTSRELSEEAFAIFSRESCVLRHARGMMNMGNITAREAKDEFGFAYVQVFQSDDHLSATIVEGEIQRQYKHLPLGNRLWKNAGEGIDRYKDGSHKVFITFSVTALLYVEAGVLRILSA